MEYKIKNRLRGGKMVSYACESCQRQLESPLTEAGTSQHCPHCFASFVSPGMMELEALRESKEREARQEDARKAKDKALDAQPKMMTAAARAPADTAPKLPPRQSPPELPVTRSFLMGLAVVLIGGMLASALLVVGHSGYLHSWDNRMYELREEHEKAAADLDEANSSYRRYVLDALEREDSGSAGRWLDYWADSYERKLMAEFALRKHMGKNPPPPRPDARAEFRREREEEVNELVATLKGS